MELVREVSYPRRMSFGDDRTRTHCAVSTFDDAEAVMIVNVRTGVVEKRFVVGPNDPLEGQRAVDYTSRYVLLACLDYVYVWDTNDPGRELWSIRKRPPRNSNTHSVYCIDAAFVPDGTGKNILLAWGDGVFEIVDASNNGSVLGLISPSIMKLDSLSNFFISPDGQYLVATQVNMPDQDFWFAMALWRLQDVVNTENAGVVADEEPHARWRLNDTDLSDMFQDEDETILVTCVAFATDNNADTDAARAWCVGGSSACTLSFMPVNASGFADGYCIDLLSPAERSRLRAIYENAGEDDFSNVDLGVTALCISSDARVVAAAVLVVTIDVVKITLYDVKLDAFVHTFSDINAHVPAMVFTTNDDALLCCFNAHVFADEYGAPPPEGLYKLRRPQESLLAALGGARIGHFFTRIDGDHAIGWRVGEFMLERHEQMR